MTGPVAAKPEQTFHGLQRRLPAMLETPPGHPLTLVVVPSFSVDPDLVARVPELGYWDHRMLYVLGRLRDRAVRVVYATGRPISSAALDHHLRLFGTPPDARDRLTVVTCADAGDGPLARQLLRRPDAVDAMRAAVGPGDAAYLECFASTELERELAVRLQIPLHGPDPALSWLGGKGQSRRLFRELGVPVPPGVEGVRTVDDLVTALVALRRDDPGRRAAVVKLDASLGGVGNAIFHYPDAPPGSDVDPGLVRRELGDRLELALPVIDTERFLERVVAGGCVVEHLVEPVTGSPSVQCLIRPDGTVSVESTHDQEMSGPARQHFAGAWMPARHPAGIAEAAHAVGVRLAAEGVVGWFGADFVTTGEGADARFYALEINLRSVGTVHHLMTLRTLVGGSYRSETGRYVARDGEPRAYFGTDGVVVPELTGMSVEDLVDACTDEPWMYRPEDGTGAVLHLLDAVGPYGRVGVTCVGRDRRDAGALHRAAVAGLIGIAEHRSRTRGRWRA